MKKLSNSELAECYLYLTSLPRRNEHEVLNAIADHIDFIENENARYAELLREAILAIDDMTKNTVWKLDSYSEWLTRARETLK